MSGGGKDQTTLAPEKGTTDSEVSKSVLWICRGRRAACVVFQKGQMCQKLSYPATFKRVEIVLRMRIEEAVLTCGRACDPEKTPMRRKSIFSFPCTASYDRCLSASHHNSISSLLSSHVFENFFASAKPSVSTTSVRTIFAVSSSASRSDAQHRIPRIICGELGLRNSPRRMVIWSVSKLAPVRPTSDFDVHSVLNFSTSILTNGSVSSLLIDMTESFPDLSMAR